MGTKGGGWEWDVARRLSKWLTCGKDDSQLIRAQASGAWATRRKAAGKKGGSRQAGDIAPNGPVGEHFCKHAFVECKAYKDEPEFFRLWSSESPALIDWWVKCAEQADAFGKEEPILIMKRNYRPILVACCGLFIPTRAAIRVHWLDYDFEVVSFDEMMKCSPAEVFSWANYIS